MVYVRFAAGRVSMTLAVLTPSYAVDYELCRDLHRSVLEYTPSGVIHHVVVPERDVDLFSSLAGARCQIWSERSVLPAHIRYTPRIDRIIRKIGRLPASARVAAINRRRPFPPIRGWILQQVLKIHMMTELDSDLVLLMDSDVELVRPVDEETFCRDGRTVLYRQPAAVTADMSGHVRWHATSCKLLGIPAEPPPLPDYISSFMAWDRQVVAAMQERIAEVAGRPWIDVLAAQLHLSEWTLYGVFADRVYLGGAGLPRAETSRCHELWGTTPLTEATAMEFAQTLEPTDLAMMISAKTRTPLQLRRSASAEAGRTVRRG
jgi:hypothetical protein